jgi:uncharacterized protein with von Willebrand factor type A (vWA) domain
MRTSSQSTLLVHGSSVERNSPERRNWIKKESEDILTKNVMLRIKAKEEMFEERLQREKLLQETRENRVNKWVERTKNSPFAVNLVAEDERISEENKIRIREDQERRKNINMRKEKAKNEIIIKVCFIYLLFSSLLLSLV